MSTILVIDDDAQIRGLLERLLEAEGHEVIAAPDAQAGLAALDLQPDAIFVDVEMPGMTGVQFLLQLRQHPLIGLTPATFVTAHQDRVSLFAQHGIAEKQIVTKPFHRKEIREALSRMLGSLSRRNLRVSLHPGHLVADIDKQTDIAVVRLSQREIFVRGGPQLSIGPRHALSLRSGDRSVACDVRVLRHARGETRFAIEPAPGVSESVGSLIDSLLADLHAQADTRGAERIPLTASITWEREGMRDVGYLRDLSASGAYVVTTTRPTLEETVMVYLPFQAPSRKRAALELRGAEAKVMRHGSDGFGCMFTGENVDFFIAINALMSDGTVVAGQGADV